jgi:2,6-dihydroxypyridine 3-monooxygenase
MRSDHYRLVNFVWYINVAAGEELDALMTGRDGVHRTVSLPPSAVRDKPLTTMRRDAAARFAPPIAAVVTGVAAGGGVPAALASWERSQLALGRALLARCRDIGDSSQFGGTFRPGDPRLIFGLHGPGN